MDSPFDSRKENSGDNRRAKRFAVEQPARMATLLVRHVRLVNISQTGAKLRVSKSWEIPDEFLLILKDDVQRWARVVWRTDDEVGLTFTELPQEHGTARLPLRTLDRRKGTRTYVADAV